MRDYRNLDRFLERLVGDVYPEAPMEPHLSITEKAITDFHRAGIISPGQRILDIGCGQGLALKRFAELGMQATGATLGPDYDICRAKGFDVRKMDQSFLEFADEIFDFLWCRHVLEHSIFPLFTLSEYRRVAKPGAHIYVEVPAPDTSCHHERNPNHYSVFGKSMWLSLFSRASLSLVKSGELSFRVPAGPDIYWAFLLRR